MIEHDFCGKCFDQQGSWTQVSTDICPVAIEEAVISQE
jgi:hypothetical protein